MIKLKKIVACQFLFFSMMFFCSLSYADVAAFLEKNTSDFKGIEKYFVLSSKSRPDIALQKYELVMQYKKAQVSKEYINLKAKQKMSKRYREFPYKIVTLDKKAGFMKLICTGCENTFYFTYWNVSDKSKLFMEISRGCGPECSDSIKTYRFDGNEPKKVPSSFIVPRVFVSEFLREIKDAHLLLNDAWETEYLLPRKGKDIVVHFPAGRFDTKLFAGNCLYLKWIDGGFKRDVIKNCTPDSKNFLNKS